MNIDLACDKLVSSSKKIDIIWIAATQVVLLVVNFLLLKVMTSRLSVESFGMYSLCMTIVLFARQVIYDPISTVVIKSVGAVFERRQTSCDGFEVIKYITERLFFLPIGAGVIFLFGWGFVLDSSAKYSVVLACLIYLCSNGAQGIYFAALNMAKFRRTSALLAMLDSIFKLLFIYLALQFIDSEVEFALIALSASTFFVFIVVRWRIGKKFSLGSLPGASCRALVKHSLGMTLPLYFPIFLGAFKSVADRWILAAYVGIDELAVFTVLMQLGYFPLILISGVVQTFVAPQVYSMAASRGEAGIALKVFIIRIVFGIAILAIMACGISIVFSEWIFRFLVGEGYRVASIYLPSFIVCGAVASVGAMLHLAATGVFDTRVLGGLLGVTVCINVVVTLVLVVLWGFVGAIIAMLLGGLAGGCLYWNALLKSGFCRG